MAAIDTWVRLRRFKSRIAARINFSAEALTPGQKTAKHRGQWADWNQGVWRRAHPSGRGEKCYCDRHSTSDQNGASSRNRGRLAPEFAWCMTARLQVLPSQPKRPDPRELDGQ